MRFRGVFKTQGIRPTAKQYRLAVDSVGGAHVLITGSLCPVAASRHSRDRTRSPPQARVGGKIPRERERERTVKIQNRDRP